MRKNASGEDGTYFMDVFAMQGHAPSEDSATGSCDKELDRISQLIYPSLL